MSPSSPPQPPSHPRPARARSSGDGFPTADRPARFQLAAAVVLGIVLVASGLYLWRRPHAGGDGAAGAAPSASAMAVEDARAPVALIDAGGPSGVTVSEARVLGCHDKGPHKTPAEQCDHVTSVEQALAQAIAQSASCGSSSTSGGTIEYVADVSFSRRKVRITLPRGGRSMHERKVIGACASAVREAIDAAPLPLEGADHEHARYQISVTATYRGTKIQG